MEKTNCAAAKKDFNILIMYFIFIMYFFIQPMDLLLSRYITGTQFTHLSETALLMLSILFVTNINNKVKIRIKIDLQLLVSITLLIIILIQVLYFFSIKYKPIINGYQMYIHFLKIVGSNYIILWVVGNYAVFFHRILQNRAIKNITYIIYLIFVFLIIFMTIQNSGFSFDITKMSIMGHGVNIVDENFDYLSFSDRFAMATLFIISTIKNKYLKILTSVSGILLLTLTLSRTSLYMFTLIIFAIWLKYFINSKKKLSIIYLMLFVTFIALYSFKDNLTASSFNNRDNRMGVLLTDRERDGSFQGRKLLKTMGEETIRKNWFFGKFLYEVERDQKHGGYIHSIKSYWAEYGLIVFILVLFLSAYLLVKMSICFYREKENPILVFIFSYTIYVVISLYFSRSYFSPYIWFVFSSGYKCLDIMHTTVKID